MLYLKQYIMQIEPTQLKKVYPFLLQGIKKQSFTYEKRFQIFWHFDKWMNNNINESKWSFSFLVMNLVIINK